MDLRYCFPGHIGNQLGCLEREQSHPVENKLKLWIHVKRSSYVLGEEKDGSKILSSWSHKKATRVYGERSKPYSGTLQEISMNSDRILTDLGRRTVHRDSVGNFCRNFRRKRFCRKFVEKFRNFLRIYFWRKYRRLKFWKSVKIHRK